MKLRFLLFLFVLSCLAAFSDEAMSDVYVRTHKDGNKEFTNRPSGPGWIFYMSESGEEPVIHFAKAGKPKGIDEIVSEIAMKFNIESSLVKAIILAESNCDPMAVSRKGAQGLMQLMPSTAKDMNVANAFDPRENILGGVKYIKGMLASYGDLKLALAAYNAGPGAVQKYAGIPPYRETINYVEKVIRYYNKFKNDPTLRVSGD
ncbi:MAG: lytic transglycosylase domain-containing protein [Desulfomonile tiedjei]|uniref:Lytic transglycosylase domain-containing protein n=1 Tax=Desulfomonile tiedjei TaxID=2358 RepID=A0A9D6Z3Z9_9BACT|nr:lytic transglycosylase domain-containing protein [Desulfomonile tiedjei]